MVDERGFQYHHEKHSGSTAVRRALRTLQRVKWVREKNWQKILDASIKSSIWALNWRVWWLGIGKARCTVRESFGKNLAAWHRRLCDDHAGPCSNAISESEKLSCLWAFFGKRLPSCLQTVRFARQVSHSLTLTTSFSLQCAVASVRSPTTYKATCLCVLRNLQIYESICSRRTSDCEVE